MHSVLLITQIIISLLLSLLILSQSKGEGLGDGIAGAGGGSFTSTRRGAEKILYKTTLILAILFVANAFLYALLPNA